MGKSVLCVHESMVSNKLGSIHNKAESVCNTIAPGVSRKYRRGASPTLTPVPVVDSGSNVGGKFWQSGKHNLTNLVPFYGAIDPPPRQRESFLPSGPRVCDLPELLVSGV
jgi:hypothetical protein